jgi:hypothetical protein
MRSISVILLNLLALVAPAVWAGDKAQEEAEARGRARAAQEERDWAARLRDETAGLAADYQRAAVFAKTDLAQHKAAAEAEAALHDRMADAHERRAPSTEAIAIQKEYQRAAKVKMVWRERIVEYRQRQALKAPSQEWWHEESRWSAAGAIPPLLEWSEARKKASEAWGRAAEACAPDADPNELARLKEEAYAADAECEIAEWRCTWARERERLWENKKVTSDELTQAASKLQQVQEERIRLRRAEIERDRRAREVERQLRAAEIDFRKAHEAAFKEYERRRREEATRR